MRSGPGVSEVKEAGQGRKRLVKGNYTYIKIEALLQDWQHVITNTHSCSGNRPHLLAMIYSSLPAKYASTDKTKTKLN
jgi:hypothetical protein